MKWNGSACTEWSSWWRTAGWSGGGCCHCRTSTRLSIRCGHSAASNLSIKWITQDHVPWTKKRKRYMLSRQTWQLLQFHYFIISRHHREVALRCNYRVWEHCKLPLWGPGQSPDSKSNFDSFLSPGSVSVGNDFASFRVVIMSIKMQCSELLW